MNKKKKIKKMLYEALAIFIHKKSNLNPKEARDVLTTFHAKQTCELHNNNSIEQVYDLQIIVPAYNVEKYLKDCINSVLCQKTQYTYKIILVDDGSTDATPTIADEFKNDERVEVIHQENRGFSGARNRALEKISGKYVMFLDSDDMLYDNAIENLLGFAFQNNAQVVEGGMVRFQEGISETNGYKHKTSGKFEYSLGMLKGFPCGKVFKAEIFSDFCFPDGFWFEDTVLSYLIYPKLTDSYYISDYVYKYRKNLNSISHTANKKIKCIDTYWIMEILMDEHEKRGLPKDALYFEKFFRQTILNCKRLQKMDKAIQESVFVLTCDLLGKTFSNHAVPQKYKDIYAIMQKRDFNAYLFYCKMH